MTFFSRILVACIFCAAVTASENNSFRKVDLPLISLVRDPLGGNLYGTSGAHPGQLLQLDANTGTILGAFEVGTNAGKVSPGFGNTLWVGLDGAGAIRSFDLKTHLTGEIIKVEEGASIVDIAQSPVDSRLVAVSLSGPKTVVLRQGVVLPATAPFHNITFIGASAVVGQTASLPNDMGALNYAAVVPSGLQLQYSGAARGFGELLTVDHFVYHASGDVLDLATPPWEYAGSYPIDLPFPPSRTSIAWNSTTDELLFLSDAAAGSAPAGNWELARFERISRRQTGFYAFPELEAGDAPRNAHLVSWGTNHAAFHTTNSLYLLDLNELFRTPSLALTATLSTNAVRLAEDFTINIVVTNKGPGSASQVTIATRLGTNLFFHGATATIPATITQSSPGLIVASFGALAPGSSAALLVKTRADGLGLATVENSVASTPAASGMDTSVTDSLTVSPIGTNAITHIKASSPGAVFNQATDRFFFLEDYSLWMLDLRASEMAPLSLFSTGPFGPAPPPHALASAEDATLYVGTFYTGNRVPLWAFTRLDARTLASLATVGGDSDPLQPFIDLEVSPDDPGLLALAEPGAVYANGAIYGKSGSIEISSNRLYLANSANCALEVYRITSGDPVLESVTTNVSCADFSIVNGLLYFEDGIVFDPAGGQMHSTNLTRFNPWFVAPAPRGLLNVLSREEGQWVLRRFRAESLEPVDSWPVDSLDGAPLDLVALGTDRAAIRTTNEIVLLAFSPDPEAVPLGIERKSPAEVTVSFQTLAGNRYRVEQSEDLKTWRIKEGGIAGGIRAIRTFPADGNFSFWRVVRE